VLGLCLFAVWLGGLWSMLPRRNVAIDVEDRDGTPIDDPSRSRLKGRDIGGGAAGTPYGTPTSRATTYSGGNPFGTDPLPPRRGMGVVEREATF
jgi:hypothetical protein